jgi:hypothetical protein
MIRSRKEEMMKKATAITCVSLDVGGVLLTGGWQRTSSWTGLRMRRIPHTAYRFWRAKLASFGLQNDEGAIHETS